MTRGLPATRRERALMAGAIACVLILIVAGMALLGFLQSPDTSAGAGEQVQKIKDNLVLGLAILVILGTFLVIAYLYTTLGLGSKR